MHQPNKKHTSFIINRDLYCYMVMLFGLKNARAIYQRLVNHMFAQQISKTMEVYMNDMLVKSLPIVDDLAYLKEMFEVLCTYNMYTKSRYVHATYNMFEVLCTYNIQCLKYHSMLPIETMYPSIALALLIASWKLKPYFQVHVIVVFTSHPLRQELHCLKALGWLMKCQWS